MSKVKFTQEQQQLLRDNPYTVKVTADVLSLSREFKEIFYREYLSGVAPRDILQKYGYPPEVLGAKRIWGIGHSIRKQFEEHGEFYDIRTPVPAKVEATQEEKIRQLEHQVDYLTQEVEFLKKITSIRSTK